MIHIPVLMLGGGGHSRVLINELFLLGHTIVGILDPAMAIGDTVSGVKVLGSDSKLSAYQTCLLYTSPSPRDRQKSRMPSSA